MSEKLLDANGRWRNKTIAFRLSPEENKDLNMRVHLSGLTKQEYITRRCQERDIVVYGNPNVYKALKEQMLAILTELKRIGAGETIDPELLDVIRLVSITFNGMKTNSTRR